MVTDDNNNTTFRASNDKASEGVHMLLANLSLLTQRALRPLNMLATVQMVAMLGIQPLQMIAAMLEITAIVGRIEVAGVIEMGTQYCNACEVEDSKRESNWPTAVADENQSPLKGDASVWIESRTRNPKTFYEKTELFNSDKYLIVNVIPKGVNVITTTNSQPVLSEGSNSALSAEELTLEELTLEELTQMLQDAKKDIRINIWESTKGTEGLTAEMLESMQMTEDTRKSIEGAVDFTKEVYEYLAYAQTGSLACSKSLVVNIKETLRNIQEFSSVKSKPLYFDWNVLFSEGNLVISSSNFRTLENFEVHGTSLAEEAISLVSGRMCLKVSETLLDGSAIVINSNRKPLVDKDGAVISDSLLYTKRSRRTPIAVQNGWLEVKADPSTGRTWVVKYPSSLKKNKKRLPDILTVDCQRLLEIVSTK